MSLDASRVVYRCREQLARLIKAGDASRIVFALNATAALNMALWGALEPGDHCITTSMEHNAVARPLYALERTGVEVTYVSADPDGHVDVKAFGSAFRRNTRLVAITHASNVTGTIMPVGEIAHMAKEAGALTLLDAAQTAGVVEIDVEQLGIDLLAAPGHKSLMGPMGTGFLYVGTQANLRPTVYGGTGSYSEELDMPSALPDRYETGTVNAVGLAGLAAGVNWVLEKGVANIARQEDALADRLRTGLSSIPGIKLYGTHPQVALVSFNIGEMGSTEVAAILDASFGICVRPGLHCAPLAHRSLGTLQQGVVRVSLGPFNTGEDIDHLLGAVKEIASC
jgi:cysteine desulfurase family protein